MSNQFESNFWKHGNVVKILTKNIEFLNINYNKKFLSGTIQNILISTNSNNNFNFGQITLMDNQYNEYIFLIRDINYFNEPEKFNCKLIQEACLPNMDRFFEGENYKLWKIGNKIKLSICTNIGWLERLQLKYEDQKDWSEHKYEDFIGTIEHISIAKNWLNQVEDVQVVLKLENTGEEKTIMIERDDYLYPEKNNIFLIEETKNEKI